MTISPIPFSTRNLDAAGSRVRCRLWGESSPKQPDIVLVHGGAAHARWWDHLAPTLAVGRRVVALDLSGHGESAWRQAYSFDGWGGEVLSVVSQLGLTRPLLVGHSMGGIVVLYAGALAPELCARVIVIDSALQMMDRSSQTVIQRAARDSPLFPSREVAIARFRLIPDAEVEPDLLHYIAASSVCEVDGGWTWRFDRRTLARKDSDGEPLTRVTCPVTIVRAERGLLTAEGMAVAAGQFSGEVECLNLAASHHVVLEQPELVIGMIRDRS